MEDWLLLRSFLRLVDFIFTIYYDKVAGLIILMSMKTIFLILSRYRVGRSFPCRSLSNLDTRITKNW